MQQQFDSSPEPKFLYTHVILQDIKLKNHYYSVKFPKRQLSGEDVANTCNDPNHKRIPPEHIWPKIENNLTICPDPSSPDIYIKRPRFTDYSGPDSLSKWLLQEARICELLINKSHPNVAQYFGCVVEDGCITGLCFKRYGQTLVERCRGRSLNNEDCLRQIAAGLDFLHSLGIVHNDVCMENVMFKSHFDDTPVIIDFDASAVRGCPLTGKQGGLPDGICTAEFRNDDYGLERLGREIGAGSK
ncbi:hypothetical protein N7535_007384 [Penicillium sp. DV-2018c]|nr:hypothetical protein N7535_007384 [Penicillium sp. DV-2018c]